MPFLPKVFPHSRIFLYKKLYICVVYNKVVEHLMRRLFIYLYILCCTVLLRAQDAGAAFQFLQLPVSSHAAALGGDNVSIMEDDAELSYHNPALLTNTSPHMLGFNYMSYLQRTNILGAGYTMAVGERSMLGLRGQYLDFGTMKNADADGNIIGNFSAKDMVLMGTYSFDFSDRLTGGVSGKFIYSNYEQVYSLALGVDLGLNYYNPDCLLSLSLVARNLGGQVKTYDGMHEGLPFNLLVGVSKDFAHAPVRLSLTLTDLHRWRAEGFYNSSDDTWSAILLKHFILGADIFPTQSIYISLGYNFLTHSELKNAAKRSLEGFAIGAGLQVSRVKVGVSYGKYHVAASSLMMNFAIQL